MSLTITFDKYKQNLKQIDNIIYSFNVPVAEISWDTKEVYELEWNVVVQDKDGKIKTLSSSPTTTKHINYITDKLKFNLIKLKS